MEFKCGRLLQNAGDFVGKQWAIIVCKYTAIGLLRHEVFLEIMPPTLFFCRQIVDVCAPRMIALKRSWSLSFGKTLTYQAHK